MSDPDKKKVGLKEKIFHEMVEYWINVIYLTIVFATFTQYQMFVLASYDITYTNYWVAVIEALILAKVIMVGAVVRLGHGLEQKPLIFPTLYKSVVFSLFVGAFTIVEYTIKGLWKGEGFTGGVVALLGKGHHELLSGCLVVFVALIPFFAVKELGRVLGEDKTRALFFKRRADHLIE
jgi:hypothetical protein